MERLIKAGLFGAGLIPITTPEMVSRYNSCLEQLGIEGTKLDRFQIDCVGWSPEIAMEKENKLYLSHGLPNQMAVILTPDQSRRPIYVPYNSFERRLVDHFFELFREEIADITTTNAVVLTIDQGLTDYQRIQDLLLIDHVIVRASTSGDLMDAARNQASLVNRFMHEKEAWFDPNLRADVIKSAKQYGDLRQRKLDIKEMVFDDLRSFYSEAFGGLFVIRTQTDMGDLLVVQDKELIAPQPRRGPKNIFWINDPRLVSRLFNEGLLHINFDWFREHIHELDYKLECLAIEALCCNNVEFDSGKVRASTLKKMLMEIRNKVPETYFVIERLKHMIQRGVYPEIEDLSLDTQYILMHPSGHLPAWYREVVWQLICRLTQYDPLRLYVADKNRFFTYYQSWSESKKAWAGAIVSKRYKPHVSKEEK